MSCDQDDHILQAIMGAQPKRSSEMLALTQKFLATGRNI